MRIRTLYAKAKRVSGADAPKVMSQFDEHTDAVRFYWMEVPCFGRLRNREHQYKRFEISKDEAWSLVRGGWEYIIDNVNKVDASCTVFLYEGR